MLVTRLTSLPLCSNGACSPVKWTRKLWRCGQARCQMMTLITAARMARTPRCQPKAAPGGMCRRRATEPLTLRPRRARERSASGLLLSLVRLLQVAFCLCPLPSRVVLLRAVVPKRQFVPAPVPVVAAPVYVDPGVAGFGSDVAELKSELQALRAQLRMMAQMTANNQVCYTHSCVRLQFAAPENDVCFSPHRFKLRRSSSASCPMRRSVSCPCASTRCVTSPLACVCRVEFPFRPAGC